MAINRDRYRGFTLVELLVVIAIIGILIGMLLPAVHAVRIAARRTACINNVRQMAIALHNFQSTHQRFPPGVVDDDNNHRDGLHSGFVFMLPYIEQGNVYDLYDQNVDWKSGPNQALAEQSFPTLLCPENSSNVQQDGGIKGAPCDYAFNKGPFAFLSSTGITAGIFDINSKTSVSDIRDGTSTTFLLGEAASNTRIPAAST